MSSEQRHIVHGATPRICQPAPLLQEGQGVGASNLAKRLIDAVRRRKGLPVEEKVVESATKQRTRARKV